MKNLYFITVAGACAVSLLLFQNCGNLDEPGTSISSTQRSIASETSLVRVASSAEDANQIAIGLYRRLSGVTLPVSHPLIIQMQNLLLDRDFHGAAELAITPAEPDLPSNFLNVTVREFATRMATREEEVVHTDGLNDFIATIIGAVRDDVDARELLTGSFFYRGQGENIPDDMMEDIVRSNNNYAALNERADISNEDVLVREEQQMVRDQDGNLQPLEDTAGLMTTRGWMKEHALAGTNRRMVEFGFQVFLCQPIDQWAGLRDTRYIGRDVARLSRPAGSNVETKDEFNATCSSCHSGMDAIRPATAHFDFVEDNDGDHIAFRYVYERDPDPTSDNNNATVRVPASEQLVPYKFRRGIENNVSENGTVEGFAVENDSWVNLATDRNYGFQVNSGVGMADFGLMLATSQQFSRCMVQRVFSTVCRHDLDTENENDIFEIERLAQQFEEQGSNLKSLFIDVAVHPSCMGVGG